MIDFPDAPALGQSHTSGYVVWIWDGTKWTSGPRVTESAVAVPGGMLTITATTALPTGFSGFVYVQNDIAAPLIVTLPVAPSEGQAIEVKDTLGNAGTYPITVDGAGQMIEGAASIVISFNYGWVDLIYTGNLWVQT